MKRKIAEKIVLLSATGGWIVGSIIAVPFCCIANIIDDKGARDGADKFMNLVGKVSKKSRKIKSSISK